LTKFIFQVLVDLKNRNRLRFGLQNWDGYLIIKFRGAKVS